MHLNIINNNLIYIWLEQRINIILHLITNKIYYVYSKWYKTKYHNNGWRNNNNSIIWSFMLFTLSIIVCIGIKNKR